MNWGFMALIEEAWESCGLEKDAERSKAEVGEFTALIEEFTA